MAGLVKKFLASASVVAGMSAVVGAPAMANPQITNIFLDGPAVIYGDDIGFADQDGTAGDLDNIAEGLYSNADVVPYGGGYILQNANHGNIELSGSTAHTNAVDMMNPTSLEVLFNDGSDITFRSMTANDWFGDDLTANAGDFFYQWLNEGLANQDSRMGDMYFGYYSYYGSIGYSQQDALNNAYSSVAAFFRNDIARFSDPNIATVQNQGNGNIFFQLAGHNKHSSGFALSEVVAVESDGNFLGYYYKFGGPDELATVYDNDREGSHEGLYNFTVDVPEPSTVLGLMAIGGLVVATKRKSGK